MRRQGIAARNALSISATTRIAPTPTAAATRPSPISAPAVAPLTFPHYGALMS